MLQILSYVLGLSPALLLGSTLLNGQLNEIERGEEGEENNL